MRLQKQKARMLPMRVLKHRLNDKNMRGAGIRRFALMRFRVPGRVRGISFLILSKWTNMVRIYGYMTFVTGIFGWLDRPIGEVAVARRLLRSKPYIKSTKIVVLSSSPCSLKITMVFPRPKQTSILGRISTVKPFQWYQMANDTFIHLALNVRAREVRGLWR